MTRLRRILLLVLLVSIVQPSICQSISDGLRMSQSYPNGTARFVSMGGAFGSIGSDFSAIGVNPAGLGVYKSSEFTFTPSFRSTKITSNYNNSSINDTKNSICLNNMGFVFALNPNISESSNGINQVNIGFGYSRTNNFNSNAIAKGNNSNNSIMDYFAQKATIQGINSNDLYFGYDEQGNTTYNPFRESNLPWDIIMAWNTYLIDNDTIEGGYNALLSSGDGVVQANETTTKGNSGEYTLSTAINISNKLFIGAVLGITSHRFEQNIVYKEDAFESNPHLSNGNRFFYSDYIQNLETEATGYNIKIGAIYTPIKPLRIGLAIHTPTFYNVNYYYSYRMKSNVDVNNIENSFEVESPAGEYDFDYETPFKFIGSISYVIYNKAIISLDIENINYSNMKFRNGGNGDNLSDMNLLVSDTYRNTTNFRIGAEYLLGQVALRAGFASYPSAYKKGFINEDSDTHIVSGGIGYNSGAFFIDAAYQQLLSSEKYKLYEYGSISSNIIEAKQSSGSFLLTFGFRF